MAATQEALYGRLDLALSWSEADLPERERTKHVHRLHPYLGKFVPQLVEELLRRLRGAWRSCPRPVCRLRDDARPVPRVRPRRGRRRRRPVQLPPDAGQDGRVRRPGVASRPRGGPRRRGGARLGRQAVRAGLGVRQGVVRAARGGRAARVPGVARGIGVGGRPARRPCARGPLGAAHDALRPRLSARSADGAVPLPQAPQGLPPRRGGPPVPAPVHEGHARPDRGVRRGPAERARPQRCSTAMHGCSSSAARSRE